MSCRVVIGQQEGDIKVVQPQNTNLKQRTEKEMVISAVSPALVDVACNFNPFRIDRLARLQSAVSVFRYSVVPVLELSFG